MYRILIITYLLLFAFSIGHAQTSWGEMFSNNKGEELEQAYQSVSSGNNGLTQDQLVKYVKTLNDFALLHFTELNEDFQKKALSKIVSTDSITSYENSNNKNWWKSKFIQLVEIMPLYAIQKQTEKLTKPIDTLQIQVPGTDKVISVIVNNKVIQGYLLAKGNNPSLADRDLRYLDSDDVLDYIAYYREEKKMPDEASSVTNEYYAQNEDSVKGKTVVLADNSNENSYNDNSQNEANTNNDVTAYNSSDSKDTGTDSNSNSGTSNNSANSNSNSYNTNTGYTEGVAFRVQIAAARNPLDRDQLSGRYSGAREPRSFNEEGWIKYYVAETADLNQAKQIRTEPGMPADAFIMSYYNGKKAPEYLYRNYEPEPVRSESYMDLAPKTYSKKIWVVQIAADQKPLNMSEVRARYTGDMPIYHINEGVWHRYSIGIFNSFKGANNLRMSCGVRDAFVAAYLDSKRINTWASMKKPAQISKSPIRYIVQVAAAQNKLSDKEIKERYKGGKEIIYFRENGYHKYAIGRYKTFREALKAREECGVPDAFIKAYRGEQKVDLIRAKNITDK
ncbi:MAG: hypothetical protein C0599_03680 [Salinivirgaceae bacterium]|nr:MAG: hypothetical protein C0599_03680 [Salinivirgaceae bacterium]